MVFHASSDYEGSYCVPLIIFWPYGREFSIFSCRICLFKLVMNNIYHIWMLEGKWDVAEKWHFSTLYCVPLIIFCPYWSNSWYTGPYEWVLHNWQVWEPKIQNSLSKDHFDHLLPKSGLCTFDHFLPWGFIM